MSVASDAPPAWLAHRREWPRTFSPPTSPALPADHIYERLAERITVSQDTDRLIRSWLELALERILAALRPHVLDVDAVVCGSFAAGTHIEGEPWDIDIAIRIQSPPPEWGDAARALSDIKRWLSDGLGALVEARTDALEIASPRSRTLDITPCWRLEGSPWLVRPSLGSGQPVQHTRADLVGHRDLIAARDRSLRGDSSFRKLIRIVKHITNTWQRRHRKLALTSFQIETLALKHCTRPLALAEGVAEFFAAAASEMHQPLIHPLLGMPVALVSKSVAHGFLAEASQSTEALLMVADLDTANELAATLSGPRLQGCGPAGG